MSTEAQKIEQIIVDHLRREGIDLHQFDGWWMVATEDSDNIDIRRLAEALADELRK